MNVIKTKIKDVLILEPKIYQDTRGYFVETFNQADFVAAGINGTFVQDNQSKSLQSGTVRGLHYQKEPNAQTKIVRCVAGAIYDVAVDLRLDSETYGQWVGVILTADNGRQLVVPKGFAHGFCTLTPDTIVAYKVDAYYSREHDTGIFWDDETLGIDWPVTTAILSEKDALLPKFTEIKKGDN